MKCILIMEILCGMIASGKSTYAAQRALDGALVANDDALCQAVHGGHYAEFVSKQKGLHEELMRAIVAEAFNREKDVIIDSGRNGSRQACKSWVRLGEACGFRVIARVSRRESYLEHAARRHQHDDRGVSYAEWRRIARHHEETWEEPSLDEGFDEIHVL